MNRCIPNTLAIIGPAIQAATVALRTALHGKRASGPLVVLDLTGRGAAVVGATELSNLTARHLVWYDLADRQRPVALLRAAQPAEAGRFVRNVLQLLQEVAGVRLDEKTIAWAAQLATRLAADGAVSLGALLKSLANSDIMRWFTDAAPDAGEYRRLVGLFTWTLRYSAVFGLSEGSNSSNLASSLTGSTVTWIELLAEHFEPLEHRLIAGLAEIAVDHALHALRSAKQNSQPPQLTVLRLFPPEYGGSAIPPWCSENPDIVRHITVHHLYPDRQLKPHALFWAKRASQLWVLKSVGQLAPAVHSNWLEARELEQVQRLEPGHVWMRSNETGRILVSRLRSVEVAVEPARRIRFTAARKRRITTVRQSAAAALSIAGRHRAQIGLYPQLCDRELLRSGWFRVRTAAKNSHGIDRITVGAFEETLEEQLDHLADELRQRRYRPRTLLRVYLSKPDGTSRPIGIPSVRDRVVQAALLILLEPIFEPSFSHFSFAFRPRRSAHNALALARSHVAAGHAWAVIADIRKCFDNIDHDVLLGLVSKKVGDTEILDLIRQFMSLDVLYFAEILPSEIGVPQGCTLSPLLCNIYLDPLDRHFERLAIKFVRYADDIVLFTPTEETAQAALRSLAQYLHDPLRLELKPAKTNYVAVESGFDFLGFHVSKSTIGVPPERLDVVAQSISSQMRTMQNAQSTLLQRAHALEQINSLTRGFRNYFALSGEEGISSQMQSLDGRIDQVALDLLPSDIRGDPAWICRERFCLAQSDKAASMTLGGRFVLPTQAGYPDDSVEAADDPGLTIKAQSPDRALTTNDGPRALLVQEKEGTSDNGHEGIVHQDGRLYLLSHGSYLTFADDFVVVKKRKAEIFRASIHDLNLVFLQGLGMTVSVMLQLKLAEHGVPVVFSLPVGPPIGILNPVLEGRSFLRGQQVLRRNDPDIVMTGLTMLAAKIGNQAAVLQYFAKYKKRVNPPLAKEIMITARQVRALAARVKKLDPLAATVRPSAMGHEGHAAALYWQSLAKLTPEEAGFAGRIHQNAPDAVNQCINYLYGILYGEVWRAVVKAGLDPYFGLIHGSQRDQGSLVFDLIEEFRAPFADRLVIALLGRGFRPVINAAGMLTTRTRRLLARTFIRRWTKTIRWRSLLSSPSQILERQAGDIAKMIERRGQYHPFKMNW